MGMVSGSHIFTFQRLLKYMLEFPECDEVSCMEEGEEEIGKGRGRRRLGKGGGGGDWEREGEEEIGKGRGRRRLGKGGEGG